MVLYVGSLCMLPPIKIIPFLFAEANHDDIMTVNPLGLSGVEGVRSAVLCR